MKYIILIALIIMGGDMQLIGEDISKLVSEICLEETKQAILKWHDCKVNGKELTEDLLSVDIKQNIINSNMPSKFFSLYDSNGLLQDRIISGIKSIINQLHREQMGFKTIASGKQIYKDQLDIWESKVYNFYKDVIITGMSRSGKTISGCYLLRWLIANCRQHGVYYSWKDIEQKIMNKESLWSNIKELNKCSYILIDDIDGHYTDRDDSYCFSSWLDRRRRNKFQKTIYICESDPKYIFDKYLGSKFCDVEFAVIIDSNKSGNYELSKEEENVFLEE